MEFAMALFSSPFRVRLGTRSLACLLTPLTVGATIATATPALAGLEVCNQTNVARWVAVGYSKDDLWTSEGWWQLEPGACTNVLDWDLTHQFYYYRAEDPNEEFEGDGYMFCTVDDAFTIVGDQDCEARGYDEVAFREVDTGESATTYTLVLSPSTVPGALPIGAPEASAPFSPPPAKNDPPPPPPARNDPPPPPPPARNDPPPPPAATPDKSTITSPFGAPAAAPAPAREGGGLSSTKNSITGRWRSVDDPAATILFEDGLYTAFHAGDRMESGAFDVTNACPSAGVDSGDEPVIVVRLPSEPEPYCYGVLYVDQDSLEMIALPRGNLLRYRTDID